MACWLRDSSLSAPKLCVTVTKPRWHKFRGKGSSQQVPFILGKFLLQLEICCNRKASYVTTATSHEKGTEREAFESQSQKLSGTTSFGCNFTASLTTNHVSIPFFHQKARHQKVVFGNVFAPGVRDARTFSGSRDETFDLLCDRPRR